MPNGTLPTEQQAPILADLSQFTDDPDFLALPVAERHKVLAASVEGFKHLRPETQFRFAAFGTSPDFPPDYLTLGELDPEGRAMLAALLQQRESGKLDPELSGILELLILQNPELFVGPVGTKIRGGPPFGVDLRKPRGEQQAERFPVGAALGATAGSIAGMGALPLGPIAGATIGGAGGEALEQLLRGSEQEPLEASEKIGARGLEMGVTEGVLRGGGRLWRALRGPTLSQRALSSPDVKLARSLGVELSLGQTVGRESPLLLAFESVLKRALGTQPYYVDQMMRANARLTALVDEFLHSVSLVTKGRRDLGLAVGRLGESIRRATGQQLGAVEAGLLGALPDTIKFSPQRHQKIVTLLQDAGVMAEFEMAGAKQAVKQLETLFAPPLRKENILIAIRALRLRAEASRGKVSGVLWQAREETLDGLAEALPPGAKQLAGEYQAVRSRYREVMELLDTQIMKSMQKWERPEGLGAFLADRANGLTRAEILKTLIKAPVLPKTIRKAFLEEIFERTLQETQEGLSKGVFPGNMLERTISSMVGRDVVDAVLLPKEKEALLRLARIANIADLPTALTRPISAQSASLLAFGQSQQLQAGVSGMLGGNVLGAVGLLLGALTPKWLARILTSRGGPELLELTAKTKAVSAEAPKLMMRMIALGLQGEEEVATVPQEAPSGQ